MRQCVAVQAEVCGTGTVCAEPEQCVAMWDSVSGRVAQEVWHCAAVWQCGTARAAVCGKRVAQEEGGAVVSSYGHSEQAGAKGGGS
jgi:hypothetical protein